MNLSKPSPVELAPDLMTSAGPHHGSHPKLPQTNQRTPLSWSFRVHCPSICCYLSQLIEHFTSRASNFLATLKTNLQLFPTPVQKKDNTKPPETSPAPPFEPPNRPYSLTTTPFSNNGPQKDRPLPPYNAHPPHPSAGVRTRCLNTSQGALVVTHLLLFVVVFVVLLKEQPRKLGPSPPEHLPALHKGDPPADQAHRRVPLLPRRGRRVAIPVLRPRGQLRTFYSPLLSLILISGWKRPKKDIHSQYSSTFRTNRYLPHQFLIVF